MEFLDKEEKKALKTVSVRELLSRFMIVAIFAILIVVIMAYMTKIVFNTEIDWREQGANAVLLVICSGSVSVLSIQWGRLKGETVDDHKSAVRAIGENVKRIVENGYSYLATEYCRAWENENYKQTITYMLSAYNLSYDQFCDMRIYSRKEILSRNPNLTRAQIKAILRAKKIKKAKYNERFLVADGKDKIKCSSPSAGMYVMNVQVKNAIMVAIKLVTSLCLSLVMVSFSVDIKSSPTFETVVACALKIVAIIISAVWSAIGGYNLSAVTETEYYKRQATEQEAFIVYCDKYKKSIDKQKDM